MKRNVIAEGVTREFLVFGGADGSFDLYDDAGDGYGEGITIPVQYTDGERLLILGQASGRPAEEISITVRLSLPDGRKTVRQVCYDGREMLVRFSDS